jgi:hypothetical protein
MKLLQELYNISVCEDCEIVYVTEDNKVLTEGAKRAYAKKGGKVVKKYRCTSGPKKGKIVSDPKTCATRKDPKKKRIGKKVRREKGGLLKRKTAQSKKKSVSKLVTKLNKRLSGPKGRKK